MFTAKRRFAFSDGASMYSVEDPGTANHFGFVFANAGHTNLYCDICKSGHCSHTLAVAQGLRDGSVEDAGVVKNPKKDAPLPLTDAEQAEEDAAAEKARVAYRKRKGTTDSVDAPDDDSPDDGLDGDLGQSGVGQKDSWETIHARAEGATVVPDTANPPAPGADSADNLSKDSVHGSAATSAKNDQTNASPPVNPKAK